MPINFSDLKSNKNSTKDLLDKLNQLSGQTQKDSSADDRFWYPAVDKAGNGYSLIRFLPAPPGEDVPFVRVFEHGFKGPSGSWYIEKSLTTLGKQDPVSEYNSQLWNSGLESDKQIARNQKRKLTFISNVYVIEDSINPENNGKVFLFRYGKKIFDKLNEAMNPQFADEQPINPFDLWSGANFKLKIRNADGYRNYDKSEFAAAGPLFKDDEKLEQLWNKEYGLQEFVDPKNFKSYDELKEKLYRVLGISNNSTPAKSESAQQASKPWSDDEEEQFPTKFKAQEQRAPAAVQDDDEDDEGLEFFKRLASK
jgi:hypothetical protein